MREKLAHLIDVLNTPKGDILSEGFLRGNIPEKVFDDITYDPNLINSLPKQFTINRDIGNKILNGIFELNSDLKSNIINYGCKLEFDICYYFGTKNSSDDVHRNSQLWHHDSVGHRLKLFIALDSGWTTYYFKGSHLRKNFFNSSLSVNERKALSQKLDKHENAIRVDLEKGQYIIFDTNGLHKGHTESPYTGEIIVFEFSNSFKKQWMGKVGKRNQI